MCKVEALMVNLKTEKRWLMVVGAYRPPGVNKIVWEDDLFNFLILQRFFVMMVEHF